MAAANSTPTSRGLLYLMKRGAGTIDVESDTLDLVLFNTALANDFTLEDLQDVEYMSEVSAYECSGVGYVPGFGGSGRQVVTTPALAIVSRVLKFTCDVMTFLGYGADDVGFMAIVRRGTSDADSAVVFFINNDDVAMDGSDLVYTPPAGGILQIPLPTA